MFIHWNLYKLNIIYSFVLSHSFFRYQVFYPIQITLIEVHVKDVLLLLFFLENYMDLQP